MRISRLDILSCPLCHGMLVLEPSRVEGDVVVEGEFKCFSCGSSFPIVDEVPDFVVKECLGLRNRVQRLLYNLYAPLYDRLEARLAESFGSPKRSYVGRSSLAWT